jgi:hypothetical protein
MQPKLRLLGMTLVVILLSLTSNLSFAQTTAPPTYSPGSEPTVTSDKEDYAPGETAIIRGTGWTLDALVDVHFEEDPDHEHHHDYHDTKVNPDGTWEIQYPIESRHLGVKFTVIVEGKTSGYTAYAYFTDGNVKLTRSGGSGTMNYSIGIYDAANYINNEPCTGASKSTESGTLGNGAETNGVGSGESISISVSSTLTSGEVFDHFEVKNSNNVTTLY